MIKSPDPVDLHVGARVKMRRLAIGVSQEKLAEALDLTFQQVQKYEKGVNRIGASKLATIARVLGVAVGFFFEGVPGEATVYTEADSALARFMASREGVMIAAGFDRIDDPKLRGAIARFVRDAGRADTTETE